MQENYFSLKIGKDEDQFGAVLRTRNGNLEELTGFFKLIEGEKSQEKIRCKPVRHVFYEADVNVNGRGSSMGNPDMMGLMVSSDGNSAGDVSIYKQPKKGEARISEIRMSEAAKVIEDIEYLRLAEGFTV